jgi:endonuclease YncB( thermonuclease family)
MQRLFSLLLAPLVGGVLFFFGTVMLAVPAAPITATPAPMKEEEREKPAPPARKKAPAGKPWQQIENCRWKIDRWNDGDSFHVVTGDEAREIVARLYFVDAPEAETAYRDRLDEQAAYFGITRDQAVTIAHEAAAFTEKQLAAPFTVWTRWRTALGRSALGRVYCIVLDSTGTDLNESLVHNGLARIYGTRTALYDGRDSRAYLARLAELEAEAKGERKGAWGFAQ